MNYLHMCTNIYMFVHVNTNEPFSQFVVFDSCLKTASRANATNGEANDATNEEVNMWLLHSSFASPLARMCKCGIRNKYLIGDPSPPTITECQRPERRSYCNTNIAKQNRFPFALTNKIQRSNCGAGSSLQNLFFQDQEQKEQVQAKTYFFHHYFSASTGEGNLTFKTPPQFVWIQS